MKTFTVIGNSALVGAKVKVIKTLNTGGKSCQLLENHKCYNKDDQVILDNWELKPIKQRLKLMKKTIFVIGLYLLSIALLMVISN